jgi:hypothetical protein
MTTPEKLQVRRHLRNKAPQIGSICVHYLAFADTFDEGEEPDPKKIVVTVRDPYWTLGQLGEALALREDTARRLEKTLHVKSRKPIKTFVTEYIPAFQHEAIAISAMGECAMDTPITSLKNWEESVQATGRGFSSVVIRPPGVSIPIRSTMSRTTELITETLRDHIATSARRRTSPTVPRSSSQDLPSSAAPSNSSQAPSEHQSPLKRKADMQTAATPSPTPPPAARPARELFGSKGEDMSDDEQPATA